MVKQFTTAVILLLAIANPFCCCFGTSSPKSDSQGDIQPPSPPVHSCCHSQPEESKHIPNGESDDNTPPCPSGCACKQAYTKAELDHFRPAQLHEVNHFIFYWERVELVDCGFRVESFTKDGASRPPPQQEASLHILYCIFRT